MPATFNSTQGSASVHEIMEGAKNTEGFDSCIADVNTIKETFVFNVVYGYKCTDTITAETQCDIFNSLLIRVETADVSVQTDPESFLDKINVQIIISMLYK